MPAAEYASDRITAALIPKAAADLASLQARTGLSKTGVVNRAISLYGFIAGQAAAGREVLIRSPDGTAEWVHLL